MTTEREPVERGEHLRLGAELLRDPRRNKGTAFSLRERDELKLRGLLPPHVLSLDQQAERALANVRAAGSDLQKYVALAALQDRNETLFFRVLLDNLEELMPIVYTPVVGEACQKFGHIFRRPRGLFVSAEDRGHVAEVLRNWPDRDVRAIVVTDGERILGLGDLGANGMGIPVGKLNLYTACAGVDPAATLPITIDVGTDNEELRHEAFYVGLRRPRIDEDEYLALMDEFVDAVQEVFPRALLQFEDFANRHAFALLRTYRDRVCCFNDDIQGTAAVALAGLLAALRVVGGKLSDQRLLFFGAGEAGIGIAELVIDELADQGLDRDEARSRCWFFDSQGLVVAERRQLAAHKQPFAHEHPFTADLREAVHQLKPTALIGVSGQPQTFTQPVVEAMAALNERPLVFALSNPTSKAECTAQQAFEWTAGRALFASGSPFAPVELDGKRLVPGQSNNAYIFPGVALGIIASRARLVPDEMFRRAARVLADQVGPDDLEQGCLYPSFARIREVSLHVAAAVAEIAFDRGLTDLPRPDDLLVFLAEHVYMPDYAS